MRPNIFDELLTGAEKPSRYIGAEVNAVRKENAGVRFLLAFPDTYEVGMSHLGLQILYAVLNALPGAAAERCFAPWPDRERQLRERRLPLTSLETQSPIADFDVIGFSLQYELSYTNILTMLDLGGIPLASADRRDAHPLILAGGPCAFNPAPLAAFIDAFVIGEGEEAVVEIADMLAGSKKQKSGRAAMLEALANLDGVYVPAVHGPDKTIFKRKVININRQRHPAAPVVPLMQTVHDRIVLEIARGCTRGCRFCQAGMIWRPYRERDAGLIMDMADRALAATGHDEISLLALSAGDYSCIEPLMQTLMRKHAAGRVALALPSLRVETLSRTLIEEIKRIRKTSFTLAPEAGTDKMRRIINKGNTAEDLLTSVDNVFAAGWKAVKLYFMIGLPLEEESDLDGIVDLSYQALRAARRRGQVTVSLSTFVPKPHTPFQWESQLSIDETFSRQNFIRRRMNNRSLAVRWHDARMSLLEGLFSRGDEKIGTLLLRAWRKGCRFDGWSEIFRFDLWQEALAETEIPTGEYLRERSANEPLPWDNIDCGVSRDFLLQERQKALAGDATPDCRYEACQDCGVCDFKDVQNIFSDQNLPAPTVEIRPPAGTVPEKVYRLSFAKTGRARFLSHLELAAALTRALRRSSLSLCYSAGYHPHPKISFATATSVGMESRQEYLDVTALAYPQNLSVLEDEINAALPDGMAITDLQALSFAARDLARSLWGFVYELILPADTNEEKLGVILQSIENFLAAESFPITRASKGKTVTRDIRPFVEALSLNGQEKTVTLTARHAQTGSVRPVDILRHVLGFSEEEMQRIGVVKMKTMLA
ncbi:MAG TPA: TIGR03960 family B12-binding radical SAM protein [Smithellaceae bacterium]|nr:TIGR03960 family B12-binding radical SAM protein [Smithellaceae bacterium]